MVSETRPRQRTDRRRDGGFCGLAAFNLTGLSSPKRAPSHSNRNAPKITLNCAKRRHPQSRQTGARVCCLFEALTAEFKCGRCEAWAFCRLPIQRWLGLPASWLPVLAYGRGDEGRTPPELRSKWTNGGEDMEQRKGTSTPLSTVPLMAWYMLALMTLDNVLSQIDRNAVSILKTHLKQVFDLNDTQYGMLVTAFLVPFAVFGLICGPLVDRFGSRVTLTGFVSVWSLATIAFAFSNTVPELMAWRAVLGAAEAGLLPATLYALVNWFPKDRLATIYAIKNPLQAMGPILTPPLIAGLALAFGWRTAFVVPGVIGLTFAALWWMADRSPPSYGDTGLDASDNSPRIGLWNLAKNPIIWGVLLARLLSDTVWYFFQSWQAGYLQERLGWSLKEVGQLLWIPPLANIVFMLAIAWLSDALIARGWKPARSRIRIIQGLALLAPAIAILPFASNPIVVIALLSTTYFMTFTGMALTNILMADLFPKRQVGTAVGLINCVGTTGAALFNMAAGPIIDLHGYIPVFVGLALVHPAAAVLLQLFYRDRLRPS